MKILRQVIHVIKNSNLKISDLIIPGQETDTKVYTFYKKVQEGELETDEEAADFFYNSDINSSSYKNLKSTLRNRLINSLMFVKPSINASEREKAGMYCIKYIAVMKILRILKLRQPAVDFCHRILKKSLHFDFVDHTIEACYFLQSHYCIRVGDIKKFEYYNELLNKNLKIREVEILANEYYLKILIPFARKHPILTETHEQAKEAVKKLTPYLETHKSPYLHYMTYYIETLIYITINDYPGTAEVCKKAIAYFEQRDYVYVTALKSFYHQLILSYTHLKMYQEGKEILERSNAMLRSGSYNWYVDLNLHLILAIHSKEYQEAYYVYNRAVKHKKFDQLNQRTKERWQVSQAYLYFLIDTGRIQPNQGDKRFTKFRMGKFLNSVPTFSKDKRGLNIPILVIQIVLTIIHKDYNKAIDRIEAIEKYRSRYLRKDENFRSNCFIKMLLQVPISGFHKAGIKRRTEKYLEQLKSVPLDIAQQANEVEIIPYEDLWGIITDALDTSFYKPRK